jgi:hypothetical protein
VCERERERGREEEEGEREKTEDLTSSSDRQSPIILYVSECMHNANAKRGPSKKKHQSFLSSCDLLSCILKSTHAIDTSRGPGNVDSDTHTCLHTHGHAYIHTYPHLCSTVYKARHETICDHTYIHTFASPV